MRSLAVTRTRDGIPGFSQTMWRLAALVCFFSVVVGALSQAGGAKRLLDLSFLPAIFLAFRYVVLAVVTEDAPRIRHLIGERS